MRVDSEHGDPISDLVRTSALHARPWLGLVAAALAGCAAPSDLEAQLSEDMSTMVELTWTSDEAAASWVEFGLSPLFDRSTPAISGKTDHRHQLIGLPPFTEVFYRAVTSLPDGERGEQGSIVTGGVPSELPDFQVTVHDPQQTSDDEFLLGSLLGANAIFAVNRDGEWLWYQQGDPDTTIGEVAPDLLEAGILYNTFAYDRETDASTIHRTAFNQSFAEQTPTELGHHAFVQLPDDSVVYFAINVQDWYDEDLGKPVPVVGDDIVLLTPDGETCTLFSTWDYAEPVKHENWYDPFYPQGFDWTHGNALSYDERTDLLLASFRNVSAVLELQLDLETKTASLVRQIGGLEGYIFGQDTPVYVPAAGNTGFSFQHDPTWTPQGSLLMISSEMEIIAAEYALDDETQTLEQIWTHGKGEGFTAEIQGSARMLANGNRLLAFGTSGIIREVLPSGEVVWELQSPMGAAFGRVMALEEFYRFQSD